MDIPKIYLSAFGVLADFWASQLKGFPGRDNGADMGDMATGLILLSACEAKAATPDKLAKFRETLISALSREYLAWRAEMDRRKLANPEYTQYPPFRQALSCDYGPCTMLGQCAEHAGIDTQRFPWKTNTIMHGAIVTKRVGYGAPTEYVYPPQIPDLIKAIKEKTPYKVISFEQKTATLAITIDTCWAERFENTEIGWFTLTPDGVFDIESAVNSVLVHLDSVDSIPCQNNRCDAGTVYDRNGDSKPCPECKGTAVLVKTSDKAALSREIKRALDL